MARWHKFTDEELEPDKSFGANPKLKVIDSWVNKRTGDMVNVLKTKGKKPYLVHAAPIGELHDSPDKFYKILINARKYANKLMKKVK